MTYDEEYDVLYITFEDKPSYGEEKIAGIVILRDINTDKITGATIFDFKKRVKKYIEEYIAQ